MPVRRWTCRPFLFLIVVFMGATPASAQLVPDGASLTVTTTNMVARFHGADLVSCVNVATGESYLNLPSSDGQAIVDVITPTGQMLQAGSWGLAPDALTGLPSASITVRDETRVMTMTVLIDPASQEVVVRVAASSSKPGLRHASWSIVGLDLRVGRLIVPNSSGVVFHRDNPGVGAHLGYPYSWQAQMAVFEGARGSMLLYSVDTLMAHKHLRSSTRGSSTLDVAVGTEASAPWRSATAVPTIEWRLKATTGDWRSAAVIYRDWLWTHRPPVAKTAHSWVTDIRTVVHLAGGPDSSLLAPIAAVLNPSRTLLYLHDWRRHAYDVFYPDYTPRAGVAAFIAAAHALGFRVMLHLDLIGVSPSHPDFGAMQAYQVKDPESLAPVGWLWTLPPTTPSRFAFINPAASAYRSLFITRVGQGLASLGADAVHLDISAPMFNDGNGPIEGRTYTQGSDLLHREFAAAFPALALGGEGENDILYRYQSFAQAWMIEGDRSDGHPINTFLFHPHVQYYGHLSQVAAREPSFGPQFVDLLRRAMLPMLKVGAADDLVAADPDNARLFRVLQQWQLHRFQPAWSEDWADKLVRYRGADGAEAALAATGGLTTLTAGGETLVALAHGVTSLVSDRLPVGWPAFDASTIYGLEPSAYSFLEAGARPTTTHVTSLPSGARLGEGTLVGSGFAHVELRPPVSAIKPLEASMLDAITGVRFAGRDWPLGNGAVVQTLRHVAGGEARTALFMHPPYHSQRGGGTFAEFVLSIPPGANLSFAVGVADDAACTDGVTFRVSVAGAEAWQRHVLRTGWQQSTVSLALFAGRTLPLRIEVLPGAGSNTDCDWAAWHDVRLVTQPEDVPTTVPLWLAPGSRRHARRRPGHVRVDRERDWPNDRRAHPGRVHRLHQRGFDRAGRHVTDDRRAPAVARGAGSSGSPRFRAGRRFVELGRVRRRHPIADDLGAPRTSAALSRHGCCNCRPIRPCD